jgi:hypothetical protein
MIKKYKPRKKKIVRRSAGGKLLSSAIAGGGGFKLGKETRDVDFWPEDTNVPLAAQVATEIGAASAGAKALQKVAGNKKLQSQAKKLLNKLGSTAAKRIVMGSIVGGPVGTAAGLGFTVGNIGPELAPLFPEISGNKKWEDDYNSPGEYREAMLEAILSLAKKSRDKIHEEDNQRYREKNPHLYDSKGKFKGMLAGRKRQRSRSKKKKYGGEIGKPKGVGAAERGFGKAMKRG